MAAATRVVANILGGRWFLLYACVLIMAAVGGGPYTFGFYSKGIAASLKYDQSNLNTLSITKNAGASFGIPAALIIDVAPLWLVLASGAAMNLVGYLMMYLAVSGHTAGPPVWLMCLYVAVSANSQTFASTTTLVAAVNSFPADRGAVLGVVMGFAGLSGAILMRLHGAFYGSEDDGKGLLLLLVWLPTAISLLCSLAIPAIPRSAAAPARGERQGVLCFLGLSLLVPNVVELIKVPPGWLMAVVTIFLLVALLVLPWAVVVWQERRRTYSVRTTPAPSAPASIEAPGSAGNNTPAAARWNQDVFRPPARGQNHSILQAVLSVDMLLLLITALCSVGGMLTAMENVLPGQNYSILQALLSVDMLVLFITALCSVGGMLTAMESVEQISESLGYPQRSVTASVSLMSLSNYGGRVVAGFGSEYLLVRRYRLPRPLALTATLVLACVGHLLIAFGVRGGLYPASLIIGFCVGALWTVLFAIISELFGLRYFSVLSNLVTLASPVGSGVLDVAVTGRLYDREAKKQQVGSQNLTSCDGVQCFKEAFLIIAGVNMVAAVASMALYWRTREFYRHPMAAVASSEEAFHEEHVVIIKEIKPDPTP